MEDAYGVGSCFRKYEEEELKRQMQYDAVSLKSTILFNENVTIIMYLCLDLIASSTNHM